MKYGLWYELSLFDAALEVFFIVAFLLVPGEFADVVYGYIENEWFYIMKVKLVENVVDDGLAAVVLTSGSGDCCMEMVEFAHVAQLIVVVSSDDSWVKFVGWYYKLLLELLVSGNVLLVSVKSRLVVVGVLLCDIEYKSWL